MSNEDAMHAKACYAKIDRQVASKLATSMDPVYQYRDANDTKESKNVQIEQSLLKKTFGESTSRTSTKFHS